MTARLKLQLWWFICCLATSDIPWDGPTGSVKVGRVDEAYHQSMSRGKVGHRFNRRWNKAIMMVEAGANEVSSDMLDAIMFAHERDQAVMRIYRGSTGDWQREDGMQSSRLMTMLMKPFVLMLQTR